MTDDILFERRGRAGIVTLNRPKALNALTHAMVTAMAGQLKAWASDPAVQRVVIKAAGEKAFCAGGDIRRIYDMGKAGDPHQLDFFADEYRLNAQIKHYPKPVVALIDGICMGGGVGISVHGSHRVGTERITFAMPETGIGFFPDVGGSYFLPRMPAETGMYCALTAGRLQQADALWTGVLTHAMASPDLAALEAALAQESDLEAALRRFATDAGPAPIAERAAAIEDAFGRGSGSAVLAALDASSDAWAVDTAAMIRSRSPMSLAITFRQVREGATLDFDACM